MYGYVHTVWIRLDKSHGTFEAFTRWNPYIHPAEATWGYMLFCAWEVFISRPPMVAELFPTMILFGLCYITFAWALYMRRGWAISSGGSVCTSVLHVAMISFPTWRTTWPEHIALHCIFLFAICIVSYMSDQYLAGPDPRCYFVCVWVFFTLT